MEGISIHILNANKLIFVAEHGLSAYINRSAASRFSSMVVSTQNNGAISNLQDDSVVEVSSIITSHGAEPIAWGDLIQDRAQVCIL